MLQLQSRRALGLSPRATIKPQHHQPNSPLATFSIQGKIIFEILAPGGRLLITFGQFLYQLHHVIL